MSRRREVAAFVLALGVGVAGCDIGTGTGVARGRLRFDGCRPGTPPLNVNEAMYDLRPTFFVGQPFNDNSNRLLPNGIVIRVQSSTQRVEFADGLKFQLENTYEVARCMRGADVDGVPSPRHCDRSAGEARVLIGTESELAHAVLILNDTCNGSQIAGEALGDCSEGTCPPVPGICPGSGSWIVFSSFGKVPTDPAVKLDQRFKVNFNERIHASSFHLEFCDIRTVDDVRERQLPVHPPRMDATIDGSFDFDLERGQAGQLFP